MTKNTIILHLDWKVFLDVLSDEDLGQWTRAIMHYMETGNPPTGMSKAVEVAFFASFERIGRDLVKYEKKCSNLKQYRDEKTTSYRKTPTRGVSDTDSECDPVPVPEPDPEPVPSSSSYEEGMKMTILESYNDRFRRATPIIERKLQAYGDDLGVDLVCRVIEQCANCGASGWGYVRNSLEDCKAKGMDLAAYEAEQARRKAGHNVRVDRASPSGNDILQRSTRRPMRLKREE